MKTDLWNTFDAVRSKLVTQYRTMTVNDDTGISKEDLNRFTARLVREQTGAPRIRVRSMLLELLLTRARIGIDPEDWFADHLDTDDFLLEFREKWRDDAARSMPDIDSRCRRNRDSGLSRSKLDLSHTSPDWRNLLTFGAAGLRDRALARINRAADRESIEFYTAVARVFDALCRYAARLEAEAKRCHAVRVIESLHAAATRPPETFQEALQLMLLYHHCQEWEGELVRSMGCFDRLMIGFYRRDLAEGRLTRGQAKELLKFFWTKFLAQTQGVSWGKNFCFGGMNRDGSYGGNELTVLCFEVYQELQVVDPKLSLRVCNEIPETLLLQAAECVRTGRTAVVFANDELAREMFLRHGKSPEEIEDFIPIGCYEPCIMGKELCCSMSTLLNFAKVVELLFDELEDPADYSEAEARYLLLMTRSLRDAMALTCRWEECWPEINPSPLLSGTMDACLEKGRDVSRCGTKYCPSGVMCAGIGTAADSLAAIRMLVFDEQVCSWNELRAALKADWNGYEKLHLTAVNRSPKWGNNLPAVDQIARRIADTAGNLINHTPNARGGFFQMGLWSVDFAQMFGDQTGATPDGRRRGDPLSKNLDAAIARDRRGVSALIHSAAKLDSTECPDGSVLDIMLHPSMVSGEDGAQVIVNLIRTYFQAGGLFVQFNILDVETLRKARKEPDQYSSVQIRLCGWNVRFVDLPRMSRNFSLRKRRVNRHENRNENPACRHKAAGGP